MLKIYCYPLCTTCQRATKYLDAKSVEYEYINIKENNPEKETLRSLSELKKNNKKTQKSGQNSNLLLGLLLWLTVRCSTD